VTAPADKAGLRDRLTERFARKLDKYVPESGEFRPWTISELEQSLSEDLGGFARGILEARLRADPRRVVEKPGRPDCGRALGGVGKEEVGRIRRRLRSLASKHPAHLVFPPLDEVPAHTLGLLPRLPVREPHRYHVPEQPARAGEAVGLLGYVAELLQGVRAEAAPGEGERRVRRGKRPPRRAGRRRTSCGIARCRRRCACASGPRDLGRGRARGEARLRGPRHRPRRLSAGPTSDPNGSGTRASI
jgi:hypothetical protein